MSFDAGGDTTPDLAFDQVTALQLRPITGGDGRWSRQVAIYSRQGCGGPAFLVELHAGDPAALRLAFDPAGMVEIVEAMAREDWRLWERTPLLPVVAAAQLSALILASREGRPDATPQAIETVARNAITACVKAMTAGRGTRGDGGAS